MFNILDRINKIAIKEPQNQYKNLGTTALKIMWYASVHNTEILSLGTKAMKVASTSANSSAH